MTEVGSWNILVNDEPGHFKFWAYKERTGKVRWGRIGTIGHADMFPVDMIYLRARQKINKGYRAPTEAEVAKYFNEEMITLWEI